MQYHVTASVEIEGKVIGPLTSIILKQRFNDHHEFKVRMPYEVLENDKAALTLLSAQKNIGKNLLIKVKKVSDKEETAYEFLGIICEVRVEQPQGLDAELIIGGYSPTILLETGSDLRSYAETTLGTLVKKLTDPIAASGRKVNFTGKDPAIAYTCQYKESNFQFLNRLSAEYGAFLYYDGANLNFGKTKPARELTISSGEDVSSFQMVLKAYPGKFSNYGYDLEQGRFNSADAPGSVSGLGQYSSKVLKASDSLFNQQVISRATIRQAEKSQLNDFTKSQKAAIASNMEVLYATSFNPEICIGAKIKFQISTFSQGKFKQEDYGDFLVTSIEHYLSENGRYYNSFECIPAELEVVAVPNAVMPIAEPQLAIVKDNNDPNNLGRVKVQMFWQEKSNDLTDWIRVMTPDAGAGKGSGKNRGMVCIPEVGDEVLVGFQDNDPDGPFVMGSLFNGKSGGGGGKDNKSKSFSTLSGSKILFEDKKITIIDADEKTKIIFDGEGNLEIDSMDSIVLKCGSAKIQMKKNGDIDISGKDLNVQGTSKINIKSNADVKIEGLNTEMSAQASAKVKGNASAELTASGQVTVKGAMIMLN